MLYADQTADVILSRILARVLSKYDKRVGAIIYDSTAPASIEFENLYVAIDNGINQAFVDTAEREYLILWGSDHNIYPVAATYAIVRGIFTPSTLEIAIGERFSCGTYIYAVTEKESAGVYLLQCETAGVGPNSQTGRLIPVDGVNGLTSATLEEVVILGNDEEDTETFRQRCKDSLTSESFGGNISDYKDKVKAIQGVGGVKVFPAWNGGGTVRIAVTNSAYEEASEELITSIQEKIDPQLIDEMDTMGLGYGEAPIGHIVTIGSASVVAVNLSVGITLASGTAWSSVESLVFSVLDTYYYELNKSWENNTQTIVRVSELSARILAVAGIDDVFSIYINGIPANLLVDENGIVSRGSFVRH
ncbi:MAG: baseplate J/gp47 family protein [Candidatus Omnitrophica bacterium]|jgi:uncharacterized phage protein gp47/JayE|nr:baseplate J/gp47 family protein [Candidatus Omnitrophota bacterium]